MVNNKPPCRTAGHQGYAEVRAARPKISWRMIIATRNRLIHGYLGIDDDTLWSITRDDVPGLLEMLQALEDEA